LATASNNLALRILLLGHHWERSLLTDVDRVRWQSQVLWLIANYPSAEIASDPAVHMDPDLDGEAYGKACDLWRTQVEAHPNDLGVLGNAANFFMLHSRELSEAILQRAGELDPNDCKWSRRLAELYWLTFASSSGAQR